MYIHFDYSPKKGVWRGMSLKWFYSLWHRIFCVKTSKVNSVLVFKPLLSEGVILSLSSSVLYSMVPFRVTDHK